MPVQPEPAYIHTLTSSFASTLDEIPQDMCRHFADLRELDAVLSQSLSGITKRIEELTDRVEGGLASLESLNANAVSATDANAADGEGAKEEEVISMFQLLHEIADDTSRIKLGGEDKIRVASLAVEHMNAYHSHLLALVRRMYDMDAAYNVEILAPFTTYPHVPPAALIDPAPENRRGAPRRTVAVQNNSYGIPYANTSNATQPNRTDGIQRGVNGTNESPNKRRRLQGQSTSHHGQRIEMVDTDENSTPRRGPAALDAEAYRPGGNTARPKTQGRKVREGRAISQHQGPIEGGSNPLVDGMSISRGGSANHLGTMQGIEPTTHTQMPAPSHKSTTQNGRGRSNASHHQAPPNPNPQPQTYSMPYAGYNGSGRGRNPYDATSTSYDVSAYTPQTNMNPVIDAAYHQGQSMNMNPNLNQMSNNSAYPHSGMGMLIPTHLPPPPGSGHGRPSSGSVSRQNVYDVPLPASSSVSRVDPTPASAPMQGYSASTKGSSRNMDLAPKDRLGDMERENGPGSGAGASGGLMPLPMMTSLPPVTTFTQPTSLSMGHSVSTSESGHGRSRGYSHPGYGNGGYSAMDNSNPSSMSASYGPPQIGYQQTTSSSAPGHSTSASYGGSGTVEKGRSDVHPSLVNNSSKELPPLTTHVRDPSIPAVGSAVSAGSGSGVLQASLARDPPFRTNSAGSGDRSERDLKTAPSRPRSGTASGGNPTTYPSVGGKYRDEVDRDLNSVVATERERDNHSAGSGYGNRHPSLHSVAPSVGQAHPSLSHPSIQANTRYVYGKDEPFVVKEERDREYVKRQPPVDRIMDDREREKELTRDARVVEYNNGDMKGDGDVAMMDVDDKARAPIRRKNVDELHSSSPYAVARSGGNDGGGVEGQVIDDDSKPYCLCGQPSFGQMLACDDLECEYEWFHIGCLSMSEPPQGEYICEACQLRRDKQNRKPGKRKGMNGGGRGRGV